MLFWVTPVSYTHLGEESTLEEVNYTVDKIKEIVERMRSMSPLYEDFIKKQK